jgi:hypothetical protein
MMTGIHEKKYFPVNRLARFAQAGLGWLAVAAVMTGCAERKVRAFPWATAVIVRPNPPVQRNDNATAADLAPDIRIDPPANNGKLVGVRPVPPRPRTNSPPPTEPVDAAKATTLVPELSPQETATAKQQVTDSLAIVERNLATTRGRKLTLAQSDIVSKITGFVGETREASGQGDWARARNLAKKAQILSEDLVTSL